MMQRSTQVLLLSSRLDPMREKALRTALALGPEALVIAPEARLPESLAGFHAVVLDGPQDDRQNTSDALQAFVLHGGALLALGAIPDSPSDSLAGLLGVTVDERRPHGEVFGKCAPVDSDLVRRIDDEFALVERFQPLRILRAGVTAIIYVNWALTDEVAAVEQRHGAGRLVATSLGESEVSLNAPAFQTLLRRALRPPQRATLTGPINAAIVGYGPTGGMGYVHGTGIGATDGLQLVAICDRSPDRCEAAAASFPGVSTFAEADAIARDPNVGLVFIATPPVSHAALALQMLEAGKHVVCEKPLCLTTGEADRLIAAAAAHHLMLTVNQNRRWDPDYLAVRRAVQTGMLGEVFNVETFVGGFEHPCRYWHSDEDISGGAAFDWGSHYVDWTLQLMPGVPEFVSATAHKRVWHDVTNADQVRIRMTWSDGREAEFTASDVAAVRKPKFYIQGTAGTLEGRYRPLAFESLDPAVGYQRDEPHFAEAPAELRLARYESGYGITETTLPPQPRRPFALHRNVADHLLLGEPLAVTPESVRTVVAVLQAAEQSARSGGAPVRLQ